MYLELVTVIVQFLSSCFARELGLELYRIQLYPGNDLVLQMNSNPCAELSRYCTFHNVTTRKRCVQSHQHKLQREILAFSNFMEFLDMNAELFIDCSVQDLIPTYSGKEYGGFYFELLHILEEIPSGDIEAIKYFDNRRNEMRLREHEAMSLYLRGLVLHPNNTYIISQFGLALKSYGYNFLSRKLWDNAVQRGLWPSIMQRPEFYYIPQNNPKPWQDTKDFPFVAKLEAGFDTIRRELLFNLQRQRFQSEDINNSEFVDDNQWKFIHLKYPDSSNYSSESHFFPETIKILQDCAADFILVKFSAIVPGTHIKPHTGPSNDRLRIHLGLIHTGGARIRVGEEWRTWNEGEVLIFDSSWEHEVHHDGPDPRVVLILDIWN